MAQQMNSGKEGEQMLPLATLVIDAMDGVLLGMVGEVISSGENCFPGQMTRSSAWQPQVFRWFCSYASH